MVWKNGTSGIIEVARRRLAELSAKFYDDDFLKHYGHLCQKAACRTIPELFGTTRTFTANAIDYEYSLKEWVGADLHGITAITYDTTNRVWPAYEDDFDIMNVQSGIPTRFAMRGRDTMVLDMKPSAKVLKLWGYRIPPSQAMTISFAAGSTGATDATVTISGYRLTLTITGGTFDGTEYIPLRNANYDTLAEVLTWVTTFSARGWSMSIGNEASDQLLSAELEDVVATSVYNNSLAMFFNPALGPEWEEALADGIVYEALKEDGEPQEKIDKYQANWEAAILRERYFFMRSRRGFTQDRIRNAYVAGAGNNGTYLLGDGGWVIGATAVGR